MTAQPRYAELSDRAAIDIAGPDWRSFLQGLLTQDVDTLAAGEIRFAALLTPQGRLLYDLFLIGAENGSRLDCATDHRAALVERLTLYRLRAKVEIAAADAAVLALWNAPTAPPGWLSDPRLPALGLRAYGVPPPADAQAADLAAYDAHRMALGVPGPADWGVDATYPIEADFDLLAGIDFKKGCFVGQETTSRMKRRGTLKSRMGRISFTGPVPERGAELLAGGLRAGEVRSGADGAAMAVLRLDRLALEPRVLPDGREWSAALPDWMGRSS